MVIVVEYFESISFDQIIDADYVYGTTVLDILSPLSFEAARPQQGTSKKGSLFDAQT